MTDFRTDQEAVLADIREQHLDAENARGRAVYCRWQAETSNDLTPEQHEENARFWDHIAELVDAGEADWLEH